MGSTGYSRAFCPSEFGNPTADSALFHIIPAPLEKSVSYGSGTSLGPEAILSASDELEPVYLGTIPGKSGIYVKEPLSNSLTVWGFLDALKLSVSSSLRQCKIPVILGGEHTVTFGAMSGIMEHCGERDVGIVQIDAHADLRDQYENNPLSHACVMRRIHEKWETPILQLGVRGISEEEFAYREANSSTIQWIDAPTIWKEGFGENTIPPDFPESIYLTFDVDGLDASLMPATGTPSPGGLLWHQVEEIFSLIKSSGRKVIGFDVVELAPLAGFHAPDFTAAVATYAGMHLATNETPKAES